MKAKKIITALIALLITGGALSQTIAVSDLSTQGVRSTPIIAGKYTRLELVKLGKYQVLDEFDMTETLQNNPELQDCFGLKCLTKLGEQLGTDFVLSGSIEGLGSKVVVSLKLINVKNKSIEKTHSLEFENQEIELQRMIGIVLVEMLGMEADAVTKKALLFRNDIVTSDNVGKINNTGPRMGMSYIFPTGKDYDLNDFFTRDQSLGGLEIFPMMTHFGFQLEKQYIGTENFSALGEMMLTVSGMEQGQFFPSVTILNGFRFGKGGYEFAFGPNFGARPFATGIFMNEGGKTTFYEEGELESVAYTAWQNDPTNFDPITYQVINPYVQPDYDYKKYLHKDGRMEISTTWVMAIGRTFRYGALNVPVNVYYSSNKHGGTVGFSTVFNIVRKKKSINAR